MPLLSAAARSEVTGEVGDSNPVSALHDAIHGGNFDDIIISTLSRRTSRWIKLDLLSKARALGLPVTHVEPGSIDACVIPAAPRQAPREKRAVNA